MIIARICIAATLTVAGLSGLSAAQNVDTVDGVARANIGTINGVAIGNVGTIDGVDNTPAAGISGRDFSDEFTGFTQSLGAGAWTVASGLIDRNNGVADFKSASYAKMLAVYTTQGTEGPDQYVEFTLSTILTSTYVEFVFRYTNAASPYYGVQLRITESQVRWLRYPSAAGGSDPAIAETATNAVTIAQGDIWVMTIAGAGDDTVIRAWRNPGTSYDRARDTPASLNGNTTPTVTFTTNPVSPVDAGAFVGFGGYQASTGRIKVDNFKGGDAN